MEAFSDKTGRQINPVPRYVRKYIDVYEGGIHVRKFVKIEHWVEEYIDEDDDSITVCKFADVEKWIEEQSS
jgi:CRISPR/Cas system-associated endoribonuclease Cas2